jgi:hypothetical protein
MIGGSKRAYLSHRSQSFTSIGAGIVRDSLNLPSLGHFCNAARSNTPALAHYKPLQVRRSFLFVRLEPAAQKCFTYLGNTPAFVVRHLLKLRFEGFCDP